MKTGLSEIIQSDDALDVAAKTAPSFSTTSLSTTSLSTITLRFVTLLAVMIALLTWAWSR